MIERLSIRNLILIDHCEVDLCKGLTIITGETGAGKTAFTQGIKLLIGHRSDCALIRKGQVKAYVEGTFDIKDDLRIYSILQEYGIDHDIEDPLIITREISIEGKSRAFINRQAVTVSTLQSIGSLLIDMIGQHSYHDMRSFDKQRELLDIFSQAHEELSSFQSSYNKVKEIHHELLLLDRLKMDKERNYQKIQDELSELEEAKLKEDEDEKLFQLYCLHSQSKDISECCRAICHHISESPSSVLRVLSQDKQHLQGLVKYFPKFHDQIQAMQEAIITLQEVHHELNKALCGIEQSPLALEKIEQRLSVYTKIKKRYGQTYQDWMNFQASCKTRLKEYEAIEENIEKTLEKKKLLEQQLDQRALLLSTKRAEGAKLLEQALTKSIQELNMPRAKLHIEIKSQERTAQGDDHVCFWLMANPGEKPSSLKESSSGGELSRILLAIKTCLAEKNNTPTIIFDEIDANVGGTTATLIGEKLVQLSSYRQVFCITHFPQVAKKADVHLRVLKKNEQERTIATIDRLSAKDKGAELRRMLGEIKIESL